MLPLEKDLQIRKKNLDEFLALSIRILNYFPHVVSGKEEKYPYVIFSSSIAGATKYIRPINRNLFIENSDSLRVEFEVFRGLLRSISPNSDLLDEVDIALIDRVVYTLAQSIGAGLDLLVNANSSRKHVGNRFEELVKCLFDEIGISNKKSILQIPYDTEEGEKIYKCENDLILSPFKMVESGNKSIHPSEVVVSVKTTSKDRMGKMFIDKMLLEKFVGHPPKVIGIFLNDVQRKEDNSISYTLVSGLFMVYTKFLTRLEGVYYLDPPPNALKEPFKRHMKPFSELLLKDIWHLLAT